MNVLDGFLLPAEPLQPQRRQPHDHRQHHIAHRNHRIANRIRHHALGQRGGLGKAVIEGIKELHPDVAFLALSASDAAEDVVAIIRAGARGYVTKTIAPHELVAAIERVHGGDAVFSPRLAGFVLDAFSHIAIADIDPELDLLTDRERDVLRHIARGYTYKETGEQLFISVKTVESHMSSVLRKLQLSNRHELTKWATDRKLI